MQVTRFAAPLAYNYLHVIRMQEYLGSDRVRSPTVIALCASRHTILASLCQQPDVLGREVVMRLIARAGHSLCSGDGNSHARCACVWDRLQHLVSPGGCGLLHTAVSLCPEPFSSQLVNIPHFVLIFVHGPQADAGAAPDRPNLVLRKAQAKRYDASTTISCHASKLLGC